MVSLTVGANWCCFFVRGLFGAVVKRTYFACGFASALVCRVSEFETVTTLDYIGDEGKNAASDSIALTEGKHKTQVKM